MSKAQDWFDEWAEKYDEYLPNFPVYRKIVDVVVENSNISKGAKVLDVGIGTGNISLALFSKAPCKITGVDVSGEMMKIAEEKASQLGAKIDFVNSSADKIQLKEGTFDFAAAVLSIHHLEEKEKLEAFKRIYNSLRTGARFALAEMTVDVDGGLENEARLKSILDKWSFEAQYALRYVCPEAVDIALKGMRDIYYKEGEYVETSEKWISLINAAGFKLLAHEKPDEKLGWEIFVCEKA